MSANAASLAATLRPADTAELGPATDAAGVITRGLTSVRR